jgi:hypothetical protein
MESLLAVWAAVDSRTVAILKGGIAVAGAILLGWDLIARRSGRSDTHARLRDRLLAVLGVAAFVCWWNLGRFHFPDYVQVHEHYHYYLGSKYFPELGYTRLYQCVAIADVDAGLGGDFAHGWIRNLSTNRIEPAAAAIQDRTACTRHFRPERWEMFKRDVAWFRAHRSPESWRISQIDHGYNGSPVWAIAGSFFAGRAPASDAHILRLALIDPLLILIMWGAVWWAFGWRATAVAVLWWGTNFPARFIWTGGAFLRADWLAAMTIGICFVKRERMASGGFALTYAALLRVFPGLLIAGLALKAAGDMWRARSWRPTPPHRAFALGSLAALALLVLLSAVPSGGVSRLPDAWREFAANSSKHLSTPLTNSMGLKTILAFDPDSRAARLQNYWIETPWDTWTAARRQVFAERAPIYWVLAAAFVVLAIRSMQRQDDWIALILGLTLIPVTGDLTCYYYSMFLAVALLWGRHPWTGIALCVLSAATSLAAAVWNYDDEIYFAISVATIFFVTALVVKFGRDGRTVRRAVVPVT